MSDVPLTREEYIAQYGEDPEASTPQSRARAVVGSVVDLGRNLAAGAIESVPQAIGFIWDSPGAAYRASMRQPGDPSENWLARYGQELMTPEGLDAVRGQAQQFAEQMRRDLPDVTQEEIVNAWRDHTSSRAYYESITPHYRAATRFGRNATQFADWLLGVESSPQNRTAAESLERAVGSAFIGVPRAVVAAAGSAIGRSALGSVLARGPGNAALRVAEALTPATIPMTAGNVALNAGVAGTVDQGMRWLQGEGTILSTGTPVEHAIVGGAGAAAILVLARGRGLQTPHVNPNAGVPNASTAPVPNAPTAAGAPPANVPPPGGGAGGTPAGAGGGAAGGGTPPAPPGGGNVAPPTPQPPRPRTPGQGSTINQQENINPTFGGIADYVKHAFDEYSHVRTLIEAGQPTIEAGREAARRAIGIASNNRGLSGIAQIDADITSGPMAPILREVETWGPAERQILSEGMAAGDNLDQVAYLMRNTQDQIAALQQRIQNTTNASLSTRLQNQVNSLQRQLQDFQNDAPELRPSMTQVSRADQQQRWNTALNHPVVGPVLQRLDDVRADMFNDLQRTGRYTPQELQSMRNAYPRYMPRQEDPLHGLTGIPRRLQALENALTRMHEVNITGVDTSGASFGARPRTLADVADQSRVNVLDDPISAMADLQRRIKIDAMEQEVRREMADVLASRLNIDSGRVWWHQHNGRTQWSTAELSVPNNGLAVQMEKHNLTPVFYPGGVFRLINFADPVARDAFRHMPTPQIGLIGSASNLWKQFTTGLFAPLFRLTSVTWDTASAMMLRPGNRDYGLMQAGIRRALGDRFGDHWATQALSAVDPTAWAQTLAGIARLSFGKANIAAAHGVANALVTGSPMWRGIAQIMGPQRFATFVQRWVNSVDNSLVRIYEQSGLSLSVAYDDFAQARRAFDSVLPQLPGPLRNIALFWRSSMDALDGGAKFAFFSQNYARLHQRYNGNIPRSEMQSLIYDTRSISGDMSRRSGMQTIQKWEQAFPYSNAVRNSLAFVYGGFARGMTDPNWARVVWPRMFAQTTAAVGMIATFLQQPGAMEYWYERLTDWQRMSALPIPANMETWIAWMTGQRREFNRADYHLVRMMPEMNAITSGVVGALTALGLLPAPGRSGQEWEAMTEALKNTVMPPAPPFVQSIAATQGMRIDFGRAADGFGLITQQNQFIREGVVGQQFSNNAGGISRMTGDILQAMFGTTGAMVAGIIDAGASGFNQSGAITALDRAFNEARHQVNQRLPDAPLLWRGGDRTFIQTAADKEVRRGVQALTAITQTYDQTLGNSATQRANSVQAGQPTPTIVNDRVGQLLREVSQYGRIPFGRVERASDFMQAQRQFTTLLAQRHAIISDYSMQPQDRLQRINDFNREIAAVRRQQETMLRQFERDLTQRYQDVAQMMGGQITLARLSAALPQFVTNRPRVSPR